MTETHERAIVVVDVDGTLFDTSERRKFVDPRWRCDGCGELWDDATFGGASQHVGCGGKPEKKPKDWSAFFAAENVLKDRPVPQVVDLAQRMALNYEIHAVTARRESDREITERQLQDAGVPYTALHIVRPDGERKPDDVLKREWLEGSGLRDRIWLVLEDRDDCVAMWRAEGLVCWQVAWRDPIVLGGKKIRSATAMARHIRETWKELRP